MTVTGFIPVTFELYRIPGYESGMQLFARSSVGVDPTREFFNSGWEIWAGSAAAYYQLWTMPMPHVELFPGWVYLRTKLVIDGRTIGDWLPLMFYAGEATDMPSGITRYRESFATPDPRGGPDREPATWALTARRYE